MNNPLLKWILVFNEFQPYIRPEGVRQKSEPKTACGFLMKTEMKPVNVWAGKIATALDTIDISSLVTSLFARVVERLIFLIALLTALIF